LSAKTDKNYDAEIQAIELAAKQHIQSFTPPAPEFNMYALAILSSPHLIFYFIYLWW
jgi:hypothetical protein